MIAKRFITDNGEDAVSDALKAVNIQVDRARLKILKPYCKPRSKKSGNLKFTKTRKIFD
jgi:hypothetical protein